MEKRPVVAIIFLIALFAVIVSAQSQDTEAGVLPGSPLYFIDIAYDNFKINSASDEKKALVAAGVHDERIAEALALAEKGKSKHIVKAITEAEKSSEIVQIEINPEVRQVIRDSTKNSIEILTGLKEEVAKEALPGIERAINRQIVQEKKTEIVAEITSKIDELCSTLIGLVGLDEAMAVESRCNPEFGEHKWLERRVREGGKYQEIDEAAKIKFFEELTICFNDPRECRCGEIPIQSFSNTCYKIIPDVIRCEFEEDEAACNRVDKIEDEELFEDLPPDFRIEVEEFFHKFEEEAFEKHFPKECEGLTTREACEKIMIELYIPQECKDAGVFTENECREIMMSLAPIECIEAGADTEEACMELMEKLYGGEREGFGGPPPECERDGHFISEEECRELVGEDFFERGRRGPGGPGEFERRGGRGEFREAPSECLKDGRFIGPQECEKIMIEKHLPEACEEAGAFTENECIKIMEGKAPEPCTQNGEFIGVGACEELMERFRHSEVDEKEAMDICQRTERHGDECEELYEKEFESQEASEPIKELVIVEKNFEIVEKHAENIPKECEGLTIKECSFETGESFIQEIPKVSFKEGETAPVTSVDIEILLNELEGGYEEFDIDEVREDFIGDVETLESGLEEIELIEAKEVAKAIEEEHEEEAVAEEPEEAPEPEPESEPEPEQPSGGEGGGITGGATLDVLKFMRYLR